MKEHKRWRRVDCSECGEPDLVLMTPTDYAAYRAEKWIWLCNDCYCDGDSEECGKIPAESSE